MAPLTLTFDALTSDDLPLVGGKGVNLGVLAHAGVRVPPGFCATTHAFNLFVASLPEAHEKFATLETLDGSDVVAARRAAEGMRTALDALPIPSRVAEAVVAAWRLFGALEPL